MIKDKFYVGLIIGILLPLATFGILFLFNIAFKGSEGINFSFKTSTVALLAICINLIPTIYANRLRYENFIRGIMFPTVLGSFVWFFYFDPMNLFN
jgi:hypothetical protein